MSWRSVVLLAVACALGLAGTALGAVASPTQTPRQERTDPPPKVDELLERFPIGTDTVRTIGDDPAGVPPPAITLVPEEGRGTSWAGLAITSAAGAAVLLTVVGTGVLVARRRRRRAAPILSSSANLALLHEALASPDREWDNLQPADHSMRRRAPVTEVPQDRDQPQPGEPGQAQGATPHTEAAEASPLEHSGAIERISAVLQSAEAAAAAIQAEAVEKAEEINKAAMKEGQEHLAKAREEASLIRREAEAAAKEAQSAAESYGADQRREAEERVEQVLAQAEAQARATRQAADEMARQIEDAAREREERLNARVRPLIDAFRRITAQLEDLVGTDEATKGGETLVDALSAPVRRTDEWEETPPQQERTSG